MASKRLLIIVNLLIVLDICHARITPLDALDAVELSDYNRHTVKRERSPFKHLERNLGKYKNFYANLLQEENQEFAVEIQELYNFASNALVEPDAKKKEQMLLYSLWLQQATKDLESFLVAKGMKNI